MFCSDLGYPWGGLKLWGRTTLFRRSTYLWLNLNVSVRVNKVTQQTMVLGSRLAVLQAILEVFLPVRVLTQDAWAYSLSDHVAFAIIGLCSGLYTSNLTIYSISQKHDFNIHDGHEKLRKPNFGIGKVPHPKLFRRFTHDESLNHSRKVRIPP